MRKWLLLTALALVALGGYRVGEAWAQNRLHQLMVDKLVTAQKLLEAIATGNYANMEKQADKLQQLANQAEWAAYKTPRYELHSNEFRRAAETLARRAKEKNLDGATLAYMNLTMSCMRCHQYVREVRDTRLPDRAAGATAQASKMPDELR